MKAKAITFDLDDTLWPILPVIIRAEEETNAWLKNNYPAVKKIMDTSEILHIRTEILNKYPEFKNDLSKLREKSYESLGLRAGYSHQEAKELAKDSFDIFYKRRNEVDLYEGVEETLKALKEVYLLGVITNGNANVKKIGLDAYFDVVVSSESANSLKPEPEIFLETIRQLNLQPSQIYHVGDHPINDVKGCYEVGMKPIWFNLQNKDWPLEEEIDFLEVSNWSELKDNLT